MQAVFEIAQVGVEADIFIRLIVPIQIADNRQIRGIGDPEVRPLPDQPLNGIETGREPLPCVRRSVTIPIGQDVDRVARGIRLGRAILRPHPDTEPSS